MRRRALLLAGPVGLLALPGPAMAHEAFGDLGPFYQALLHPAADPAQGLLLVAAAILLARQPLATMRAAWPALAAGGVVVLLLGLAVALPAPGLRPMTLAALAVALAALVALRPAPPIAAALALVLGGLAALPLGDGGGLLRLIGGVAGIALATLFLWGAADWADRHISPLATTVAAAWVAAIALMAAVLPTA